MLSNDRVTLARRYASEGMNSVPDPADPEERKVGELRLHKC